MMPPKLPANVSEAYDRYSKPARRQLLMLRDLIFDIAHTNPTIGTIHETLKWGEPSYLTPDTKSGSTIRLSSTPATPDICGIYLNCNTTLIADIKDIYPTGFTYQKNRAALFPADHPPNPDILRHCLELALTYHARKNH